MSARLQLYIVMAVLVAVGLGLTAYKHLSLGFPRVPGVDVVLDRHRGPLVLELNARPGLAIQVANGMGMKPRMDRIEAEIAAGAFRWPAAERAAWSLREFRAA